jgi:hypothetical protein
MNRRNSLGEPKGNSYVSKHGRYMAEHLARRHRFATLLGEMKELVERADGDE